MMPVGGFGFPCTPMVLARNGLQNPSWKLEDSYVHISHGRFRLAGPAWSMDIIPIKAS